MSCKIDTVFQQVCSVCVHLTPQFLQKLTVVGCSYSRTTRYPVCHDHTFTIIRESHHLFHVRLGPLEFFQFRGTFASPLTGLRFQFRLKIPDPGFVNSNHLCRNSFPSSRNLCNNCCAIYKRRHFCSSLRPCGTHRVAIRCLCKRSVKMR